MKTQVKHGIYAPKYVSFEGLESEANVLLTTSDSLASAGRRVGGASLWRSIESNTRTSLQPSGLWVYLSILQSSTIN